MRRRIAAVVLAAACFVFGGSILPPSHAAFPGRNGVIVYSTFGVRDAHSVETDLYAIRPDGTHRRRLTKNGAGTADISPAWSPDGRLIAWGCRGGSEEQAEQRQREICLMRADGSHKRAITDNDIEDDEPTWSPGGKRLGIIRTYKQDGEFVTDLFVIDRRGRTLRRLTRTRDGVSDPEWSPNGKRIAFSTGAGLRTIRPDGTGRRDLFDEGFQPSWSPDGRWVVFETTNNQIAKVRKDGTGYRQLTDGGRNYAPDWSPDGDRIVYTHGDDLFSMDVDGTHRRRITGNPDSSNFTEISAAWQPR